MENDELPTEDVQFEEYKKVAEAMHGNPVIIRTMDIGGDKELKCLDLPEEMNPFLGYRAIRISLNRPDIFKVQLRALLRASAFGDIHIMYPMIASVEEVKAANEMLDECKEELIANGILKEKIKVNKKKNKSNYFVINHNGTAIYVGKNNLQNDAITNKLARRDYLWFHAKDIPGSHVVIFDNNPSEETIEVASMLAAYYSKFKNEEYVNVDRTLIKNVKKISGAKPGLVTYTGQKTVKQKIDKDLIESF